MESEDVAIISGKIESLWVWTCVWPPIGTVRHAFDVAAFPARMVAYHVEFVFFLNTKLTFVGRKCKRGSVTV